MAGIERNAIWATVVTLKYQENFLPRVSPVLSGSKTTKHCSDVDGTECQPVLVFGVIHRALSGEDEV
jgi:hypothetical protein